LYLAALGPLTELFGVLAIVAVFALLRSQADRRAYFQAWEKSWVLLAVALTIGLFHERFVDPESVFYPASRVTTHLTAAGYMGFRLLSVALVIGGAERFAAGTHRKWLPIVAVAVAAAASFLVDTSREPLAPLALVHGPVVAVAYLVAAIELLRLPRSRHAGGTRLVAGSMVLLGALAAALAAFYLLQRTAPDITGNPWLVRFARYGFYLDGFLQAVLAWSMVRVLFADGRRESDDARAQLRLMQDREQLGDLYDRDVRLLTRRAFETMVGLDFARASYGSVAHVRITNVERVLAAHGPAVAAELVAHTAGVLASAVRPHDRVYRWAPAEVLVVMPRAVPAVARSRVESIIARAASVSVARVTEPLRAEVTVGVHAFTGGEDLPAAATAAAT
jgi:GGDEF domain-containing protein